MVLVLCYTGIRCEHEFAMNAALVRQFNAIKSKRAQSSELWVQPL